MPFGQLGTGFEDCRNYSALAFGLRDGRIAPARDGAWPLIDTVENFIGDLDGDNVLGRLPRLDGGQCSYFNRDPRKNY